MKLENANWIQAADTCEAPYFRKNFYVSQPIKAQLTICGLGCYELYVNGHKINHEYFVPVTSDYHPRDTSHFLYPMVGSFTHRTYYDYYDVSHCLADGKNTVGVALGNGWYNQHERVVEGQQAFGLPRLTFRLEIDGAEPLIVTSDETVRWHGSEVIFNNLFFGEKHDLRLAMPGWQKPDFDDSAWEQAAAVAPIETTLCLSDCPGDRVARTIVPKMMHRHAGRAIYDAGENLSGWVELTGAIKAGETVQIRHAEALTPEGELDFASCGGSGQIQATAYMGDGSVKTVHPKFSWQAFRYFEVTGEWEKISETPLLCAVVNADVAQTSRFRCSNETLNWLYEAYIRTQLSNMHAGVPLDTPNRERLGYTGDGQLGCHTVMLTMDVQRLYKKWIRDILDCQDKTSGRVQHTAPFQGGGGGPAAWGAAIVEIPYQYYIHYGDSSILHECFAPMLHWFEYLESRSEDGLVTAGEPGGWCLGEWNTTAEILLPAPFVNTYFYAKSLLTAAAIADTLAQPEHKARLLHAAAQKKAALKQHYFNELTNTYCGGVQGADAFAADIGLANPAMLQALNNRYAAMNEFDTGIFGTDILMRTLFANGYEQTAYNLLTADGPSSFKTVLHAGGTTLWESFLNPDESQNHPMFGAVTRYLFTNLLGIQYQGKTDIRIKPAIVNGLDRAEGKITTRHGDIEVKYIKGKQQIEFFITCTGSVSARLEYNDKKVDLEPGMNTLAFPLGN